jgi:serine/threonine-protein kinase
MAEPSLPPDSSSGPDTSALPPFVGSLRKPALPPLDTAPPEPTGVECGTDTLPPPATPGSPTAFPPPGRYVIRGEIARGGMGAVLHGLDTLMERDLAIKVLSEGLGGDLEHERRFFHEARVHGRLQHPGIVPIYELGRLAEQGPFFTMKLVHGHTLAALLRNRASPAEDLPRFLKIFEQVCQTLAYAHSCGVLHRDLKPLNIMVGAFGEVQVMDWGLAKELHAAGPEPPPAADAAPAAGVPPLSSAAADQTEPGTVLGTPAYMASEQARGEMDRLDERADVFGLGAILCEILTGKPPFTGQDMNVLLQAAAGDIADACARLDASGADPELVRLAKQCLARDRDARPRDAGAVARAMTAYLAGVQERLRSAEVERAAAQAKAAEARAKAAAERRAHRLTLGLAAALLLLGALAGGGWLWLEQRRSTTSAAVNVAFLKAENLHEQARGDLDKLTRAVAALKEAQALAEGGYCDEALRTQVQQARARAEDEERQARQEAERQAKHQQMLARLQDLRSRVASRGVGVSGERLDAAVRAYVDTFAGWQLDVDRLTLAEAVTRVRAYPPELVRALAVGLDHWVQCDVLAFGQRHSNTFADSGGFSLAPVLGAKGLLVELPKWRHRLAVASAVDPDPIRNRLRDALLKYDAEQFTRTAREADAATLPTDTIQNMTPILWVLGERDLTLNLLRKAALARPDDFWIQHYLSFFASHVGSREEALAHGMAAVALQPTHPAARENLGTWLEHAGRLPEALHVWRQTLPLDAKNPELHHSIGHLLVRQGELAAAIPYLREAVRLAPSQREFHHDLAAALRASKDLAGALAAYQAAVRADPRDAEAHWQMGLILREQGKLPDALDSFHQAAQRAPKAAHYALSVADTLRALGKEKDALPVYRDVVRLDANSGGGHYGLGLLLRKQGKADEALGHFAAAVRSLPDLKDAHEFLGQGLEAKGGDPTAAVAAHREMLRRWPAEKGARDRLAAALTRQGLSARNKPGGWELSAASYRESLTLRPDDPTALDGLGLALIVLRRDAEALAPLSRLAALRPKDPEPSERLAWACQRAGKSAEAVAAFRDTIRRGRAHPSLHMGLGKSLLAMNDVPGAVAAMREAIRQHDISPWQIEYALALRRNKQLPEALAASRAAVRSDPSSAPAHLLLGDFLTEQGKPAEALPSFQEAMRLRPAHDVAMRIGQALVARGSVEDAIAYLTDPIEPQTDQTAQAYTACLVLKDKGREYRACCAALLKRFGRTRNGSEAYWIARSLSLTPNAGTDPTEAVRLAAIARDANQRSGWCLNIFALAYLRAGQPDKALERIQEGLTLDPGWHPPVQWLVRSLAHRKLGHTDEARRWLDQVRKAAPQQWINEQDRLFYECLRREAEAGHTKTAGPK